MARLELDCSTSLMTVGAVRRRYLGWGAEVGVAVGGRVPGVRHIEDGGVPGVGLVGGAGDPQLFRLFKQRWSCDLFPGRAWASWEAEWREVWLGRSEGGAMEGVGGRGEER